MTTAVSRPFCADIAREAREPLAATASRVEHWLLIEYGGYWPKEPLDAAVFAGPLRDHLAAQLAALPRSRLLLVKRAGRRRARSMEVIYGRAIENGGQFRRVQLEGYTDLLELDLAAGAGEPLEHPLLLVCTHGIRDRCCARYGQALLRQVAQHADPAWVWQTTHVGGDRFAGNIVILPEGLYYGRVAPDDVVPILAAYGAAGVSLRNYRGRSCYPFAVQAAEIAVRSATGLTGIRDLRLVGARRDGREEFTIELLAARANIVHELEVGVEYGEPAFLTCKAEAPQRPRHYVVRAHRERPAGRA